MMHDLSTNYMYLHGAARFKDLIYLAIRDRKLVKDDVEHSVMIAFYRGELAKMDTLEWTAVDSCVIPKPDEKFLAISEDGEVYTYVSGSSNYEKINHTVAALRAVQVVDGQVYACGMRRQVFRRDSSDSWFPLHIPEENLPKGGLESIVGFASDEMYAVGWHGEIWVWDGNKWYECGSPTNQILTQACIRPDGKIVAVGHNGIIVEGRGDAWEVIMADELSEDLWDVCAFQGDIYISSFSSIYKLDSSGINPVDFSLDAPDTTYQLSHAEDVLWSIGSDDVFSFDGDVWKRLD